MFRFEPPSLKSLDAIRADAICLLVFSDDRPLKGTASLVDWRLCGSISRLLQLGWFSANLGEQLLVSTEGKLPFPKSFLFGLGPRHAATSATLDQATRTVFETLVQSRSADSVWAFPNHVEAFSPPAIMEVLAHQSRNIRQIDEVTLIETASRQKQMMPVLDQLRRRLRAEIDLQE